MSVSAAAARESALSRWLQLLFGFIAMMSISSPQYVWTVFVEPFRLRRARHWLACSR